MKGKLTERQRKVLKVIRKFRDKHGYPPTIRELSAAMGFSSHNAAVGFLDALEAKGYIQRHGGSPRAIKIL